MYEHLDPLRKRIAGLAVGAAPPPWKRVASLKVGGLRAVGFDRDSDYLLITSLEGRGVVDCLSGEKILRDDDLGGGDEGRLEAEGMGPLANRTICMAGLFGGGLPTSTDDGWHLETVTLEWPVECLLLIEPGSELYGSLGQRPDRFVKLEEDSELRAYGFSFSGRSLVIATTSSAVIYTRPG